MHLLLAKRFTATALRKHLLSSPIRIGGVAFGQSRARNTARITGGDLHGRRREGRFYSDDTRAVDPSWVRRVTEVPMLPPKPQVTEAVSTSTLEPQVRNEEAAPAVKRWGKYPRASKAKKKEKKSDDASLLFTPPTGTEVDIAGSNGNWPTTPKMLTAARDFIEAAAASPHAVLLVPDHDADGLSAGTIISLTLQLLGKPADQIHVHFVHRGRSISDPKEKEDIESFCREHGIGHIIILDQGSRGATEALIIPPPAWGSNAPKRKTLIIDRYYHIQTTLNTTILSSKGHPPVASTSLLAYTLCCTLHPTAPDATALLAIMGTLSSSSSSTALEKLRSPPVSIYLNTAPVLKKYTIKWINMLISLLNIAHRSPLIEGDATRAAWGLLQFNPHDNPTEWPTPKQVMSGTWGPQQLRDTVARLTALQERSRAEMDRLKRMPPKLSSDRKIAVIEIASPWNIHTSLAGRWVGLLGMRNMQNPNSPRLLGVAVANRGYVEGEVNFSVRKTAYAAEMDVDLVALLKGYASTLPSDTRKRMGEGFVWRHKEATKGSLETGIWERYRSEGMKILGIGGGGGGGVVVLGDGEAVSGVGAKSSSRKWTGAAAETEVGATGVME